MMIIVGLLIGIITLVVRFRMQKHNLIKVITREGALYYLPAFCELL